MSLIYGISVKIGCVVEEGEPRFARIRYIGVLFFLRDFNATRKNAYQQNKMKKKTQNDVFLHFFLRALAYMRKKQYLCTTF